MAKADNKPKINTLKGDRARLAERAYQERLKARKGKTPSTKPQAQAASGGSGGGKPPVKPTAAASAGGSGNGKGLSTNVRVPRMEKDMGKAERVQSYLKNSTSQIKSGIRDLKRSPKSVLQRLFKSLPQGRSARLAVGALAGAGAAYTAGGMVDKAVTSNTKSAAEKQKAYAAARDDVPEIPSTAKDAAPKKSSPQPATKKQGGSKASGSKGAAANTVRTKGGDYPVYNKNSSQAASFRAAFAAARKAGKKVFTWEGRKYNTKLKGE